jgi:opacity protein-like surface antigen
MSWTRAGATASAVTVLACTAAVTSAQAQPRLLAGATFQSYVIDADEVDGTLPAAGVVALVPINPLLDFEIELLQPVGTARREYTGVTTSFAPFGATREEIEREGVVTKTTHERRLAGVLSFGAAFHPRRNGSRIEPRFVVGVTTHFMRNRSLRDPVQWPASVTLERILQRQPPIEEHRRALGSLTLGAGLAFDLTRHLVVTLEFRSDYGSMGDEINNTWRAGTRVLWRF